MKSLSGRFRLRSRPEGRSRPWTPSSTDPGPVECRPIALRVPPRHPAPNDFNGAPTMTSGLRFATAAFLLATASPALAAPSDDLAKLLADHWAWVLREQPLLASSVGVHDYDTEIGDFSLAAEDRRARDAAEVGGVGA